MGVVFGTWSGKDAVESLVHDRGAADPDSRDVLRAEPADLLSDEGLVPPLRVNLLLAESKVETKVANAFRLAVVVESLEKFESNALLPAPKRDIQMELESFEVGIAHVRLLNLSFLLNGAVALSDVEQEVGNHRDQVHEAKHSRSGRKGNVHTLRLGTKAVAHGTFDNESLTVLVLSVDLC